MKIQFEIEILFLAKSSSFDRTFERDAKVWDLFNILVAALYTNFVQQKIPRSFSSLLVFLRYFSQKVARTLQTCIFVLAFFVLFYYVRSEGVTLCPCNPLSSSKSNIHVHVPDDQLPPMDIQNENGALDSGAHVNINTVTGNVSLMVNQNYTPVKQAEENC